MAIDLQIGDRVTRAELNARYGGGIQGGMLTPQGGRLMFLFSDVTIGKTFGYTSDGWANDERSRFSYTGEGAVGPQRIDRGRNKVLLESLETGREVHLFYAVGFTPGRSEKVHEYLGEFSLDPEEPWTSVETTDQHGEPRTAVRFNLIAVDQSSIRPQLAGPFAAAIAEETLVTQIGPEASAQAEVERAPVPSITVQRRERVFEDGFIEWLRSQGMETFRLRILPAGETSALVTDAWVPDRGELFEAKGDATRADVRAAISQLLDYQRHISPRPRRSTVLLPLRPAPDLIDLVASTGLHLAVFDGYRLEYIGRPAQEAD